MTSTPGFANPPVTEVAIGVFFDLIPDLVNGHFGQFWERHKDDWPTSRDARVLPYQLEQFDDSPVFGQLNLHFSQDPEVRFQFLDISETRILQLQKTAFIYNWRKAEEDYPRFHVLNDEFTNWYTKFQAFAQDRNLSLSSPRQWEVTYVNSIPKGVLWESVQDWESVLCGPFLFPDPSYKMKLESVVSNWSYVIGENDGRLRASVSHAKDAEPETLTIKLSTRGPIKTSVEDGLKIGHNAIVTFFKDITSGKAHSYWELEDE
ncbi:MAG: hypothetical protein CMO55_14595 [Verrucomicrobiales bacterium]|nr:hypothetical protein [Verrucomicrobiales bacterium]